MSNQAAVEEMICQGCGLTLSNDQKHICIREREPVHNWFELTYAQYLTVPRSIMEAMPAAWQSRMVWLFTELDETFDWRPSEGRYWVELRDAEGRFVADRLKEYRHPDHEYIESLRRKDKQ